MQKKTLTERFMEKVERLESGCWLWRGATHKNGYGRFRLPKPQQSTWAHRAAWVLFRGAIPPGLCVLHRCDNPPCVNPDHLWVGTVADNMRDRDRKGRGLGGPNRPRRDLLKKQARET
jgi:hypothetical protein